MKSLIYLHQQDANRTVAWQPSLEHQALRLFDFPKSRIPVLVDKENLKKSENRSKSEFKNSCSRIPISKTAPKNDRIGFGREKERSTFPKRLKLVERQPVTLSRLKFSTSSSEGHRSGTNLKQLIRFSPESKSPSPTSRSKKCVKLHGLELTSIPEEIFNQSDLEMLVLSPERESCLDFKLPFLPSAVGRLTKLRTLVLDTNELHDIPNEIEHLRELETLILGNNNLSTLPDGLAKLNNLKSLHLANNRFDEMPLVICNLASLRFLDMSDNLLVRLPNEISNLAGTLQTLLLVMNQIEALPVLFSLLTYLSCLWLGENNLKELPEDFGELFRLDWGRQPCSSNIEGNPLVRPPVKICQQGPLEIRKYFHELKAPPSKGKYLSSLPHRNINRNSLKLKNPQTAR